jgi:hypothetical protein
MQCGGVFGLVSGKTDDDKQDPPMKLVKSWPKRPLLEIPDEARKILHRVGLALSRWTLARWSCVCTRPDAIVGAVVTIGVVTFLIWVYQELRQAPVLGTYTAAGYPPGPFWAAPLCGTTLALGIGVSFVFLMHGDEQRAIALATAKTGPGYHYFVTNLSSTGNQGAAEVLAYDDQSIKTVQVKC